MKYVVFILITLFSEGTHSQDLISVANSFLNNKDYVQAKEAIDEAFLAPDANENPRAWYTKARVYHEILKAKEPRLNQFKSNPKTFVAGIVEAYNKTISLTPKTNNLHVLATNQIEILWASGINDGYSLFQSGKFREAVRAFEVSQAAKPRDTTAYLNAGVSAQNAGMYQVAINNYMSLKDLTTLSISAFNGLIICNQLLNSPLENQLDVVEDALFEYPNYVPYIIQEVRLLVRLNRFEAAESILNTSMKRNPNNAQILLRRADLYDRIFKSAYLNGQPERSERYFELASNDYERYLNSFPKDFTANYNYAVMINEQANRVYVRINLMSKEEYEIRGKETEQIGHNWTRRALPFMEVANDVKPNDDNVVRALSVFYERLMMDEKLAALNSNGN